MVKVKKDYPTDEAVCNQEHGETEESTDSQHIIVPFQKISDQQKSSNKVQWENY